MKAITSTKMMRWSEWFGQWQSHCFIEENCIVSTGDDWKKDAILVDKLKQLNLPIPNDRSSLWVRVGLALYGLPTTCIMYSREQNNRISYLTHQICKSRNSDKFVLSAFHIGCLSKDDFSATELIKGHFRVIFVTKISLNDDCLKIIDDMGRVYEDWDDFQLNNRYPLDGTKFIIAPRNGIIKKDNIGNVPIEDQGKFKKAIGNVTTSFTKWAIWFASAILLYVAFPITMLINMISLKLGIGSLRDKWKHKESIHPMNNKALYGFSIFNILVLCGLLLHVGAQYRSQLEKNRKFWFL